ncbi:pyridoxamine 5'-phosphate oxidase family protein [Streptomyces sp. NPDC006368]|uniref:pyridoxamine 5'-phosphate oxidase family protein n=1 Tax=Streptomyces sp. NPDC006368 TaxID=3156760 RepID=UPI0033ABEBB7
MNPHPISATHGERLLQERLGTAQRAAGFYDRQVRTFLTPEMRHFIRRQAMVFLSTAGADGTCDVSFRSGPPGFVVDLDDRTVSYPEYRGNGVMASAGNIMENPHLGLLFIDFTDHHIGLHVNGAARLHTDAEQRRMYPHLPHDPAPGRRPELWVHLTVEEAYVHCSKHIPHLEPASRPRTGAQGRPRDADYFVTDRAGRPEHLPAQEATAEQAHAHAPDVP